MGFSDVKYDCGAFFNRATSQLDPGFQIDLIFDRQDRVVTVCEIKYYQTNVGPNIIQEMQRKLELLNIGSKKTVQKMLITPFGVTKEVINRAYFDRVLTLKDIFD